MQSSEWASVRFAKAVSEPMATDCVRCKPGWATPAGGEHIHVLVVSTARWEHSPQVTRYQSPCAHSLSEGLRSRLQDQPAGSLLTLKPQQPQAWELLWRVTCFVSLGSHPLWESGLTDCTYVPGRQTTLHIQTAKRQNGWDFHPGLLEFKLQVSPIIPYWIESLMLTKLPKLQMSGSLDISNEHILLKMFWDSCLGNKGKSPSSLFGSVHLAKLLSAMTAAYEAPLYPQLSHQQIWSFRAVLPELLWKAYRQSFARQGSWRPSS